jgi:hypothetical protein
MDKPHALFAHKSLLLITLVRLIRAERATPKGKINIINDEVRYITERDVYRA